MKRDRAGKIRAILFAVVLAALLIFATTAGSVWHHHATAAAESTCPICHLGHQPLQQSVVSRPIVTLVDAGPGPVVAEPLFLDGPEPVRTSTRAPPSSL